MSSPFLICLGACFSGVLLSFGLAQSTAQTEELGLRVEAPTLGLAFNTPLGWRLGRESHTEELLLFGNAKKDLPLLRVRFFSGRLGPEDRLDDMQIGLPELESKVKFLSSEKWRRNGRRFETARALFTSGTKEYHALFTIVDQPKKLQHGFWFFGKKADIKRHWPAVQASIASAKSIATPDPAVWRKNAPKIKRGPAGEPVFRDKSTGLSLQSWPAGFALESKTEGELSDGGLLIKPLDDRAHEQTSFRILAGTEQPQDADALAASTLQVSLEQDSSVIGLRRVPLRIGGISGVMLRWTKPEIGARPFLHEVYLVQKGSTVLRIEFVAEESWARVRSRRTLVKDFVAGVSLR